LARKMGKIVKKISKRGKKSPRGTEAKKGPGGRGGAAFLKGQERREGETQGGKCKAKKDLRKKSWKGRKAGPWLGT